MSHILIHRVDICLIEILYGQFVIVNLLFSILWIHSNEWMETETDFFDTGQRSKEN